MITVATKALAADLASARQQGWAIRLIDRRTVKLIRGPYELVVDATKGGEHTRERLRRLMCEIRESEHG